MFARSSGIQISGGTFTVNNPSDPEAAARKGKSSIPTFGSEIKGLFRA